MEWQVTETGGVTDAEFRHALTTGAKATALTLGAYGPPQAEAHAANAFEPVTFRHADAWRGPAAEQARSNVHAQASNVNALAELDHERRGDRNESLGVHAQARKGTEQGRAHLQEQLVAAAPRMNAAETKLAALRHQGDALEADHKRTTDLRGHHKGKAKRTRKRTGRWRGLGKKHAHNAAAVVGGRGSGPGDVRAELTAGVLLRAKHDRRFRFLLHDPAAVQRWVDGLMVVEKRESGFNEHAVNHWDSNARAGHPSKGALQFIDSTFHTHALPGYRDIWSARDQAAAFLSYVCAAHNVSPDARNLRKQVPQADPNHAPQGY